MGSAVSGDLSCRWTGLVCLLFQKGSALKRKNLLQGANSFLEEWTPFEELCPIEVNRNSCFSNLLNWWKTWRYEVSIAFFWKRCKGHLLEKEHLLKMIRYRISSVIRQSFFSFQNNPKDLDPSCKMDLDLWDCLGRVKLVL